MRNNKKKFKEKDLSKVSGGSSELIFNVKPGVQIDADVKLIDNRQTKYTHEEDIQSTTKIERTYVDIL